MHNNVKLISAHTFMNYHDRVFAYGYTQWLRFLGHRASQSISACADACSWCFKFALSVPPRMLARTHRAASADAQCTSLVCRHPPALINLTHCSCIIAHLCSCGRLQPSRAPSSPRRHAASVCSRTSLPGGCPAAGPDPRTPPGSAPCRPPVAPASKPCKATRLPAPVSSRAAGLGLAAGSRAPRRRAASCSSLSRSLAAAWASAASCAQDLQYHTRPMTTLNPGRWAWQPCRLAQVGIT